MESLGNLARIDGFKANAAINGKQVVFLDTNTSITFLVESIAALDQSFILGPDVREKDRLHTLRSWLPSTLLDSAKTSEIQATIDGTKIVLTNREDNPSNPFVMFEVVKVI